MRNVGLSALYQQGSVYEHVLSSIALGWSRGDLAGCKDKGMDERITVEISAFCILCLGSFYKHLLSAKAPGWSRVDLAARKGVARNKYSQLWP